MINRMGVASSKSQYRVDIVAVQGYMGDYPRYVYVDAVNAADAVSEARAYLRVNGYVASNFDLKVGRVKG